MSPKRFRAVCEIMNTERVFAFRLQQLQTHVYDRLVELKAAATGRSASGAAFDAPSVESAMRALGVSQLLAMSMKLRDDLIERIECLTGDECDASQQAAVCVGDIFQEFAPFFKMYGVYCTHHRNVAAKFAELASSSGDGGDFVRVAERGVVVVEAKARG